jgi:hypothetical protein
MDTDQARTTIKRLSKLAWPARGLFIYYSPDTPSCAFIPGDWFYEDGHWSHDWINPMPKAISKTQLKALLAKVLEGQTMKKRRSKSKKAKKSKKSKKVRVSKKSVTIVKKTRKPSAYNRFFAKSMKAMKLKGKPQSEIHKAAKAVGAAWRAKKGR